MSEIDAEVTHFWHRRFFLSLFCCYLSLCLCFLLCYAVNKDLYNLTASASNVATNDVAAGSNS